MGCWNQLFRVCSHSAKGENKPSEMTHKRGMQTQSQAEGNNAGTHQLCPYKF